MFAKIKINMPIDSTKFKIMIQSCTFPNGPMQTKTRFQNENAYIYIYVNEN